MNTNLTLLQNSNLAQLQNSDIITASIITEAMTNQTLNAKIDIDITAFNYWKMSQAGNERTVKQYVKIVWYFIQWLEAKGITRPGEDDINGYKMVLLQEHKPATVQNYLVAISQFFKWLNKLNVYPDITKDVKSVKVDHTYFKHDYLTSDEIIAMLQNVDRSTITGKRDYAILLLMVTSGLRTIEITSALITDITKHGTERRLYIKGKGDHGITTQHADKTQYVKIAPLTYEAINEYLTARNTSNVNEPLFISHSNRTKNVIQELDTRSIRRITDKYFNAIGIKDSMHTAHSLRHTTATQILLNGGTLEQASQVLRHKSINTTRIYNHAITRESNNSEQLIENALFNN